MTTPFTRIYEAFFNKIQKDADFFCYYNVAPDEAMLIAKERSKELLKEAIARLTMSCVPDVNFNDIDEECERINFNLTRIEVDLLASLMREKYFEKDFVLLKAFQINFSPKDLQLFSPANERKTFTDMYKDLVDENQIYISNYASRDRLTGKYKMINYSIYNQD
jgi:hypothetical protein